MMCNGTGIDTVAVTSFEHEWNKTIVFDVAGTIHLKSDIRTQKDYLTIAGRRCWGAGCRRDDCG